LGNGQQIRQLARNCECLFAFECFSCFSENPVVTKKAKNEPDCYETANVVVTSIKQECDRREDSDSIQSINVSTKEAHEKFNKTVLSSDQSGKLFSQYIIG
jgi:hypothetical protein